MSGGCTPRRWRVVAAAAQIPRRVLSAKIAPALERPPRLRFGQKKLRRKHNGGSLNPIPANPLFKSQNLLAHKDDALDHPIERPAVKQFFLTARAHARDMVMNAAAAGFLIRRRFFLNPRFKIADVFRADA